MNFAARARPRHTRAVEITPLIDVVFLLIIFFMTTARFAEENRMALDLPKEKGEQREQAEEAGLIVNIAADGSLIVNQEARTLAEVEAIVRRELDRQAGRAASSFPITIRADRNADSRAMNDLVDRLRGLGVTGTRLATEVPQ